MEQRFFDEIMRCTEGVYIIEEESKRILYANEAMLRGRPAAFFAGVPCYRTFFDRDTPCDYCAGLAKSIERESAAGGVYSWDYFEKATGRWYKVKNRFFTADGRRCRVCNINLIEDAMRLSRDALQLIAENQSMEKALEYEAMHDRMTGLCNRNCYNRDIAERFAHCDTLGVVYFDINNLKETNDCYRHEEGDRLILRMAESISAALPANGYAYRVGGDEFVILLNPVTEAQTAAYMTGVQEALAAHNVGEKIPCSAAAGYVYSAGVCDVEALVSRADKRMYEDKRRRLDSGTAKTT